MKKIYIIGAGGFGREVADTIHEINARAPEFRLEGFIDDDEARWGEVQNGIPIAGGIDWLIGQARGGAEPLYAVVTVADPGVRKKIVGRLEGHVQWANIISPLAHVTASAEMGEGNIMQHFSSLNSNARLGSHCIMNCNAIIGHDTVVGDYVSIMPAAGIMGECHIAEGAYFGLGAMVIQGKKVGENAVVGAGCINIKDVEANTTVVGNPARV
ncbi:MAG: acetyltransferase, partial [Clostridiales Family XIII bacterium]|nr:acetyltransferase [Clostridiales Family XIII bacterium]